MEESSLDTNYVMNGAPSDGCGYAKGELPECAPLAVAFVPMQSGVQPVYDAEEAIQRGTLFPGLDLPFQNLVNMAQMEQTPLGEVMALCFVCNELQLYLDTHPGDTEAFRMLKQMLVVTDEAKRRYTQRFGPLTSADLVRSECYDWLAKPWPWKYSR